MSTSTANSSQFWRSLLQALQKVPTRTEPKSPMAETSVSHSEWLSLRPSLCPPLSPASCQDLPDQPPNTRDLITSFAFKRTLSQDTKAVVFLMVTEVQIACLLRYSLHPLNKFHGCKVSGFKYIHQSVQPSPLSNFRTFSLLQAEILSPLVVSPQFRH